FTLEGERCPILWDNHQPDLGPTRGGSPSMNFAGAPYSRTADDFISEVCSDQPVCYLAAWIWTNGTPPEGFFELYEGTCANGLNVNPRGTMPGTLVATLTPTRSTPTGETATIDGRVLNGYKLEFYDTPSPLLA